MTATRVLLADDHEVVRRGLCGLLEAQPDLKVCCEAATGREAVEKAKEFRPDLVVMDLSMPELNGLEATRKILKANPQIEVLILTMYDSEQMVRDVLDAGARGYVLKSDAARDLVEAVRSLRQHRPFFTSRIASLVLREYVAGRPRPNDIRVPATNLTPREREVLQLVAEGKSNKEVAAELGISLKTAEAHRANIMRKMNFHSLSDLIHYAVRNNIVLP